MFRESVAAFAAALALAAPAFAQDTFRAPRLMPVEAVSLPAPLSKSETPALEKSRGLIAVADVRGLAKAARVPAWIPVDGGYVTRFTVTSQGATGIRARLDLGVMPGSFELHAQGNDPARVESAIVDPTEGTESWTPWTEGATQVVELFSAVLPAGDAIAVGALAHFSRSPFAKAAMACTLPTACPSGEPALDAQIAERKKSSVRLLFQRAGQFFTCSATLIDTPRRPAAYLLTANHCIDIQGIASTVASFWFYESTACNDSTPRPGFVQLSGTQLVYTSFPADQTLLLMTGTPPAGAVYAPLNPAQMPENTPVVSISHPDGDTTRWATGESRGLGRYEGDPFQFYTVYFNRGLIEGGSSGSGIYTATNGRLELRGVLSLGAIELNCEHPNLFALYARLEVFYPQISQYIGVTSTPVDDAPNRPLDTTGAITPVPIDTLPNDVVLPNRRIDYAGDVDMFRFTVANTTVVTAFTTGAQDTVGAFYDIGGRGMVSNDDAQFGDVNTGVSKLLTPGTYYFGVGHWDPTGTGTYDVHFRTERVNENYTALWWNAAESGWGVNVNHQSNTLFATLFTYNPDGSPVWLVLPNGPRQADGSYFGPLYRTTGPAFNAAPWTAISSQVVGDMRLTFPTAQTGILTYTFNGVQVTKSITRQAFRDLPVCGWSAFDRTFATNLQDLWWNPSESGWGVNITHQEDTLFATLFTYAPGGQPMWYVMPDGEFVSSDETSLTYSGTLYRTTGPAFNTEPWTAINSTVVGTMSFRITNGNSATMTYTVDGVTVVKQIQRQVFGTLKTQCES